MRLKFHTLDVFTTERFGGNPLAVVHDADGLDAAHMQQIAREFNLAETVFVMAPANPAHSARVRIFTPGTELPFAGHPTVGTAALLADLRLPGSDGERDALIVLEQAIGNVRVGVRLKGAASAFAEFDAPKLPEPGIGLPPNDALASALGLLAGEIGFEGHKPMVWSAGVPFAFVPVASLAAIRRASVQAQFWVPMFTGAMPAAAYLYCRETEHTTAHFHARMFAPGKMGVPEDPATGSAAAALAGAVHRFDRLPDGTHRRTIEQGYEMGRPSTIALTMDVQSGKLHTVRIGGHAVRVSEGTIEV